MADGARRRQVQMLTPMQQIWSRLIRFYAPSDSTIYYGEPVDPEVDVGLAVSNGETVEAWVIDADTPWDRSATRTDERKTVHKVSLPRMARSVARCKELTRQLLSPLSAEMSGAVRAIGLNHSDHAVSCFLVCRYWRG